MGIQRKSLMRCFFGTIFSSIIIGIGIGMGTMSHLHNLDSIPVRIIEVYACCENMHTLCDNAYTGERYFVQGCWGEIGEMIWLDRPTLLRGMNPSTEERSRPVNHMDPPQDARSP